MTSKVDNTQSSFALRKVLRFYNCVRRNGSLAITFWRWNRVVVTGNWPRFEWQRVVWLLLAGFRVWRLVTLGSWDLVTIRKEEGCQWQHRYFTVKPCNQTLPWTNDSSWGHVKTIHKSAFLTLWGLPSLISYLYVSFFIGLNTQPKLTGRCFDSRICDNKFHEASSINPQRTEYYHRLANYLSMNDALVYYTAWRCQLCIPPNHSPVLVLSRTEHVSKFLFHNDPSHTKQDCMPC